MLPKKNAIKRETKTDFEGKLEKKIATVRVFL